MIFGSIVDNMVSNTDTAIKARDLLIRGVVGSNQIEDSSTAIAIRSSTEGFVRENVIRAADVGIHVDGASPNTEILSNQVEAATGIILAGEGAEQVRLRYNDFGATSTAIKNTVAGTVDARVNYYGPRGPVATTLGGNAIYDPFLTVPPEEIDPNHITELGTDATMPAGDEYALGIPGSTDQTVGDVLGPDFEGKVFRLNSRRGPRWLRVGEDHELRALDALRVAPRKDARAVLSFHLADEEASAPTTACELRPGWNFVAAPLFAPVEEAFAESSADLAKAQTMLGGVSLIQPDSQLGPPGELGGVYRFGSSPTGPTVSALTGYFVLAGSRGTLPPRLDAGPTLQGLYAGLGLSDDGRPSDTVNPANPQVTTQKGDQSLGALLAEVPDAEKGSDRACDRSCAGNHGRPRPSQWVERGR